MTPFLDSVTCRRVDAVQATLASLTAIPPGEQILMCDGARLDAAQPLSAYGLPSAVGAEKPQDVFLYNRSHLRPGAPLPPPEALSPIVVDGALGQLGQQGLQGPGLLAMPASPATTPAAVTVMAMQQLSGDMICLRLSCPLGRHGSRSSAGSPAPTGRSGQPAAALAARLPAPVWSPPSPGAMGL